MENIIRFILAGLLALPALATAGVVVIAHPSVSVTALTADQVSQIYLGRSSSLPGGQAVQPLDQAEGSPARDQFAQKVLGRSEQQLRSYWSRMIFTGKGQPPRALAGSADVLRQVAGNPGFIGYVDSKEIGNARVKVLLTME